MVSLTIYVDPHTGGRHISAIGHTPCLIWQHDVTVVGNGVQTCRATPIETNAELRERRDGWQYPWTGIIISRRRAACGALEGIRVRSAQAKGNVAEGHTVCGRAHGRRCLNGGGKSGKVCD